MGSRYHRRALCLLACLAIAGAQVRPVQADDDLVRAVKATYLYKFAPFVQWPAHAFSSPEAPLIICVIGDPAMADLVRRAVGGLRIDEHAFAVHESATYESVSNCQILYLGEGTTSAILEAVRGQPILTVTDAAHGYDDRGIVHFLIHAGRVRFEIDARLARESGLTISARVLELALRVKRAAGPSAEPHHS